MSQFGLISIINLFSLEDIIVKRRNLIA